MTAIEKRIVKMLKEGSSQSAIASTLGVPRSTVQRVSDQELGVDPASLKSLTTESINAIKAESEAGASNRALAEKFGVSAKTIARALMVNIVEVKGSTTITVISPITEKKADGGIADIEEVMEGSLALDSEDKCWYVGKFIENHGLFLCIFYNSEAPDTVLAKLFKKEDLKVTDGSYSGYDKENVQPLAELTEALTQGADKVSPGTSIYVVVDGEKYPLRGSLDARRRVGYFDAVMNRTLRLALSSVEFLITVVAVEEDDTERKTKNDLSAKSLDVFLNEHQIMILPESIVIAMDGKAETITTSHQSYDKIVEAIHNQDIKLAYTLMKPREAIKQFTHGQVSVVDREVTWSGHKISGSSIAKRLMALMLKGDYDNLERLGKFLDKMFQNPSAALVQSGRIYEFMAYSDIEIDEDGDIILYKSVRGNYLDKHSGTINNTPGTIVRMARSFVNDNNKDLCSYGLHVCSLAYLKQCFGSLGQRVVRCKLNPRDIVSITDDYKSSKIRCCEYLVLDDYTAEYNRQRKSIDVEGLYR